MRTIFLGSIIRHDGYNGHTTVVYVCTDGKDTFFAHPVAGYYTWPGVYTLDEINSHYEVNR